MAAKKRKTLPKELGELLNSGDLEALKKQFSRCEPNAVTGKYGSNVFSLVPLPREFAFWAKEQGADVNFLDHYGKTPLFNQASFYNGNAALLIELGADVNARSHDNTTPLHLAATYGRAEAVKVLLAAGARVDARQSGLFGRQYTPLEMAAQQHRIPFEQLAGVCGLLLEAGAELTNTAREGIRHAAEQFQRNKRGMADPGWVQSQTEGLEKLYQIFGVPPAEEVPFHDGVSPIHITETGFTAQYNKIWDYLIPPAGRAATAQGEAVRIAGRVRDELLGNGGANWDGDYRKMLAVFPEYLRLGNPLPEQDQADAARIARRLAAAPVDDKLTRALCEYAVKWVLQNPQVLPPLEADYNR